MSLKKTEEMGKGAPSAFVDIWKKKFGESWEGQLKCFWFLYFFTEITLCMSPIIVYYMYDIKGSGPFFFYCELDKLRHVYGKCHLVSPMINMKQTDSTVYIYMIDNNDFSIVLADISLSLVLYWQSTYHCH